MTDPNHAFDTQRRRTDADLRQRDEDLAAITIAVIAVAAIAAIAVITLVVV